MYFSRLLVAFSTFYLATVVSAGKKSAKKSKSAKGIESDPECAAQEIGLELFQYKDPRENKIKLVQSVDTETCTYKIELSFEPDVSVPFIDSPVGPRGALPFNDVPADWSEKCGSEGRFAPPGDPVPPVTVENHAGLNTYYTEYSATVFPDKKFARKTGLKEVVLASLPCGLGPRLYPGHGVHLYTESSKDERSNFRCSTGGGFSCAELQCSDRGRKFREGLTCPSGGAYNLPKNFVYVPVAAIATQGLHAVDPVYGSDTSTWDLPAHLIVQYGGEFVANNVYIPAGFSKGFSRTYSYKYDYVWSEDHTCRGPESDSAATSITTEYDPNSGRTTLTSHGNLRECSGKSFTKVIDYSTGAKASKSKAAKGSKKKAKKGGEMNAGKK